MDTRSGGSARRLALFAWALPTFLLGAAMAVGGVVLVLAGGSLYYVFAGTGLAAAAALVFIGRLEGRWLFALVLVATLAWAIAEVGADAWALAPRVLTLFVLGGALWLLPRPADAKSPLAMRMPWAARLLSGPRLALLALVAVACGAVLHAFVAPLPADPMYRAGSTPAASRDSAARTDAASATSTQPGPAPTDADWPAYGRDRGGSRFSPLTQLAPANVAQLRPAWTYRTGDVANTLSVTPLKIADTLYLCTGSNDVIALDAETGAERWRFRSRAEKAAALFKVCRGVAYFRVPAASGECAERIYTNTVDARLIALDAHTGRPCTNFGKDGTVDLLRGMADAQNRTLPGYYHVTSAPTVVRGRIVLGGWVSDAQYWGEPSGVIRAFDAVTGALAWAFDMGRPDRTGEPPPGENYTPSTPNSWAPMSADEELGLVYAPTGIATGADYYGVQRRPFDDQYSSSVVALDADTGRVRWSFQTVTHDLWDYDVAAQPVLADLTIRGEKRRALVQATKTGELFVLDRVTGTPLYPVTPRRVSTRGAVPEERVSPTQPESAALPSFRGPDLDERSMWGLTPLDQLWCRIQFRKARYDGIYTPPGTTSFVQYPGYLGGINWGSVAVDPERGLAIVNASRMAVYARLLPRAEADALGRKPDQLGGHYMHRAQWGTPYAVWNPPFLSPLRVPCQQPPYGTLSAVDLSTGRLAWTKSFGTARGSGPLGLRSGLPFAMGVPNFGGSLVTRSGLVFIGASQDGGFRAFDSSTGEELWHVRLVAGANATPLTYLSSASGRQFVVVAAGGTDVKADVEGEHIVAFALPAAADSNRKP